MPRRCQWILSMVACLTAQLAGLRAATESLGRSDTLVVFNRRMQESESVARHYARRRHIHPKMVLGLSLPQTETILRKDYAEDLEKPVLQFLRKSGALQFDSDFKAPEAVSFSNSGVPGSAVKTASIRHIVLCYGVPSQIVESSSAHEPGAEKLPTEFRRNAAAVDTELATLPDEPLKLALVGPRRNPVFGTTNAAAIGPAKGVIIVARLDAPTPSIVTNMIDNALKAEEFGLWGRAYFDSRGLTNGSYKAGDDWVRSAARVSKTLGWETALDESPDTLPPGYIMSHIALYAGWYHGSVCGPFLQKQMEFVPGAIAYHLHSLSASTIRSDSQSWVGPLLAKGATATLGYVAEPYLQTTAELGVLFSRLLIAGFSFGEAAYASIPALSWQTTVIGDPHYKPVPRRHPTLHSEMELAGSPLIEWSYLRLVNLNLQTGMPAANVIGFLESSDVLKTSPMLQEKIADLYLREGKVFDMIKAQEKALSLSTSPQQKARIILSLAPRLALYEREKDAVKLYKEFLTAFPDYADKKVVQDKLDALEGKPR